MARQILLSQEDLNAVFMQDSTLEGHNTLAERVRGEIFRGIVESDRVHAYVVLNVALSLRAKFPVRLEILSSSDGELPQSTKTQSIASNTKFSL